MKTILLFSALILSTILCCGQWSYNELTEAKWRIGVTSLGTKAYFAGGESADGQVSAVEIYDVEIDDWDTIINLFIPRSHIACVAGGDKVFFAGGADYNSAIFYDIIEFWDTETRQWEFGQLLAPRFSISAVSNGSKVMFAGGVNPAIGLSYDIVEIYDTETGSWSTTSLSMPRAAMGAAVAGDLAFFAGGFDLANVTNRVDIYNFTTNSWSIDSLSQARLFVTATAVGNKVLFAGGTTSDNESSDRVDIFDTETGTWDTESLSQPRAFWEANSGSVCDERAYFVGGGIFDLNTFFYYNAYNIIDIYDLAEDAWTIDTTLTPVLGHAVIGMEDQLLIAGGKSPSDFVSTVQIFNDTNCIHSGINEESAITSQQSAVMVYPNPTGGIVDFRWSNSDVQRTMNNVQRTMNNVQFTILKVYNAQWQEVATVLDGQWSGGQVVRWDATNLPAGIYYYKLTTKDQRMPTSAGKIVKY